MGRAEQFWNRLTDCADLAGETQPGQCIVEIAGTGRVLIENHSGILGYSRNSITVKVRYGCVQVCGCALEIRQISRDQLLICGQIEGVSLKRRG